MSYSVSRFQRWHLTWMQNNGTPSEGEVPVFSSHVLQMYEDSLGWTFSYNGDPILCGGFIEVYPGRHHCWTFLNENSSGHMLWVTRQVRDKLNGIKGRLEFTVRRDFEAGHQWAKLLGFAVENPPGILEKYGPMGEDHIAYVRFNEQERL